MSDSADAPRMFADRESVVAALKQLSAGYASELEEGSIDEVADELLESGEAAAEIGRMSFEAILASFLTKTSEYEGFADFANMTDEQVAASPAFPAMRKMAQAGVTGNELTAFVRAVQEDLLENVLLALDNNVDYDEVAPYSEFGVYLLNTHTNEPEAHVDGLHEIVTSMFEQLEEQDPAL